MAYPNGCRYVGLFHNDKRHGYGKCWYPNGLGVYTGHWKANKKCGKGSMVYANGDVYEGMWEDDLPNGVGTLTTTAAAASSKMKSGASKHHPTSTSSKGDDDEEVQAKEVYKGQFLNQKKSGKGTYIFANGDIYEGSWENNVRHGKGVLITTRSDDGYGKKEVMLWKMFYRGKDVTDCM
jgi:hypothetical protein